MVSYDDAVDRMRHRHTLAGVLGDVIVVAREVHRERGTALKSSELRRAPLSRSYSRAAGARQKKAPGGVGELAGGKGGTQWTRQRRRACSHACHCMVRLDT